MFGNSLHLIIIVIFTIFTTVKSKRDYSLEIQNITPIVTDIPFVKSLNFSLTNEKAANMDLIVNRNITKWPIKLAMYMLSKNKKHRFTLLETTFDVCQSFEDRRWNNFVGVFFNELFDKSNLPRKCPFVENVLYSVRNYTVDDDCYPPILPDASWKFILNLNNADAKTGVITISGRVKK
ncbi:uncharacterized protein LOC133326608 [Musca vetustissima]|uniref:uncharacterized protein LOC133326608 n=1 Tax=Musca vetustissima TaxID=27455 RepID=UPI002AB72218|nr:uncharacterized protein LOC133326608 [Musca vetustissima]